MIKLPAPFKKIKDVAVQACNEDGAGWMQTKEGIWLNPHGDTDLVIPIPSWLAATLGIHHYVGVPGERRQPREVRERYESLFLLSAGREGVERLTERYNQAMRDFARTIKERKRRNVIQVTYSVLIRGSTDGEGFLCTPDRPFYERDADVSISLSFDKHVLINECELYDSEIKEPVKGWPDHMQSKDVGKVRLTYLRKLDSENVDKLMPYSDELWDRLTVLRNMFAHAGRELHTLLNKPGADLAKVILTKPMPLALTGPDPVINEPEVKPKGRGLHR